MNKESYLALTLFSMTLLLAVNCLQTLPLKHYYITCPVPDSLPTPSKGIKVNCYFVFWYLPITLSWICSFYNVNNDLPGFWVQPWPLQDDNFEIWTEIIQLYYVCSLQLSLHGEGIIALVGTENLDCSRERDSTSLCMQGDEEHLLLQRW